MKEVKGYLQRKSMLYKTGVEYGDFTMNHIFGCSHGCKYPCYAFLMAKRFGRVKTYEEWIEPTLVSNTIDLLKSEIPRLKSKIKSVQLCFTSDPFMYGYEEIEKASICAIRELNEADIKCIVLTKGILPERLGELSPKNIYGITLVSLDEKYRVANEPGSAPYKERINSLRKMNEAGFKTWVSMEPYPSPNIFEQNLENILNSVSFVDKIIFGRTNYNKDVNSYKGHKEFFHQKALEVMDYCKSNGKEFHIKKGTLLEERT